MKIDTLVVGMLDTNCYILKKDNNVIIIDPGAEGRRIEKYIDGNVVGIITTHSHDDHIGSVRYLKNVYNCKVFNKENLKEGNNTINNFEFEVIYTPGHYPDLITIYFNDENIMFVGDFIFKNSIGRYDFPESSIKDMKNSINKILKYDNSITLYPGHYEKTTLGEEREMFNYFLSILN